MITGIWPIIALSASAILVALLVIRLPVRMQAGIMFAIAWAAAVASMVLEPDYLFITMVAAFGFTFVIVRDVLR